MWFNVDNLSWDIDNNPPIQFNKWSQFKDLLKITMAAKDSFDAFVSILRDKIDALSENANQSNVKIIQNELKDKFDDLVKSQGYVSSEEYEALKALAKRLEKRVSKS